MSKPVHQLRLGPLPRVVLTNVILACLADLYADLERYASLHVQAHGEHVDAVAVILHMLAIFIEQDRAFKTAKSRLGRLDQSADSGRVVPEP